MKIVSALAATLIMLTSVPAAIAQPAGFSDQICFGVALFSADKATDADSRKLIGMFQTYYLGKVRVASPNINMSDAVAASLDMFKNEADKVGAIKACLGSIQNDLANLDTLNAAMAKGK